MPILNEAAARKALEHPLVKMTQELFAATVLSVEREQSPTPASEAKNESEETPE